MFTEDQTEEEFKARFLAHLNAVGLSAPHLRLERGVSICVGRKRLPVKGRYDVLVLNQEGRNLILAELKRPEARLRDADKQQALSYARLQLQMPPLVLLTNGRETSLLDTLTGGEITGEHVPARWNEACSGSLVASPDDIRLREEALQFFIGYSQENVTSFCRSQQAETMGRFRGGASNLTKKYLPDVYVPRLAVRDAFRAFLASGSVAFVLSGPSGVGKTNEMCALAEDAAGEHLALFFSGTELFVDPGRALAEEFSWHFTDDLSLPQLCRRLHNLTKDPARRVVVFIDAADECTVPRIERALSDLARHFAHFDGSLRLVASVKTTQWQRFAHFGDAESPLAEMCFRPPADSRAVGRGAAKSSFELDRWDAHDASLAFGKYRGYFHLADDGPGVLADELRDPFALRVLSEVCAGGEHSVSDLAHVPTPMLRLYLEKKLEKSTTESRARQHVALEAVGRALLALDPSEEGTEVHSVFESAALEAGHPLTFGWPCLPPEVFDAGLLARSEDAEGRARVAFQYDRVRDYVVTYHILKLDTLSPEQFEAEVARLITRSIAQEALWSYLDAPHRDSHDAGLRAYARKAADRFLASYDRGHKGLGRHLRENVWPRTTGDVGLAYALRSHHVWTHGFFVKGPEEPSVVEESAARFGVYVSVPRRDRTLLINRVEGLRQEGAHGMLTAPEREAGEALLECLREAVGRGCLDETGSVALEVEKVLVLASSHRRQLELPTAPRRYWGEPASLGFDLLPIDLDDLRCRAHGALGAEQAHHEALRRHRLNESDAAMRHAREEARAGRRFSHPLNVRPVPLLATLTEVLDRLAATRRVLDAHYLLEPDLDCPTADCGTRYLDEAYSDAAWRECVARLWMQQLDEYAKVVETNLPELTPHLATYASFPLHILACVARGTDARSRGDGTVSYAYLEPSAPCPVGPGVAAARGAVGVVQVFLRSRDAFFTHTGNDRLVVTTPHGAVSMKSAAGGGGGMSRLLGWGAGVPLGRWGERSYALMPLRSAVYHLVSEDLRRLTPGVLLGPRRQQRPDWQAWQGTRGCS